MQANQLSHTQYSIENNINFSTNWNNKLCTNKFTTIRLSATKYKKECYYEVFLGNERIGVVKVLEVIRFHATQLPRITANLDTGYTKEETLRIISTMYKKTAHELNNLVCTLVLCQFVQRYKALQPKYNTKLFSF